MRAARNKTGPRNRVIRAGGGGAFLNIIEPYHANGSTPGAGTMQ
jgi:hypothetical protein